MTVVTQLAQLAHAATTTMAHAPPPATATMLAKAMLAQAFSATAKASPPATAATTIMAKVFRYPGPMPNREQSDKKF